MLRQPVWRGHQRPVSASYMPLVAALFFSSQVPQVNAVVYPSNHDLYKFDYLANDNAWSKGINRAVSRQANPIPLIVTNNCPDTIWPAVATQAGEGPESRGFGLGPGETRRMSVGPTWQGRVWGRTNCTTDGDTATCDTGDCSHRLECEFTGEVPTTLAEFNLAGGVTGLQTFYDLSLVDGYNLPVGLVYNPAPNTSDIPPNVVNAACIGTAGYLSPPSRTGTFYTNSSYPMPYESYLTNEDIADWCPWDLQVFPPTKPGDGVYPYPDDEIQRPIFDPCKSACAAYDQPQDCCTGEYNDPTRCGPGDYSKRAKAVCPDAYSYAFDDRTSTFIIPSGGGWEVVFCPSGRSTNILATFADELPQIAHGEVPDHVKLNAMNLSYIMSKPNAASYFDGPSRSLQLSAGMMVIAVLF